MARLLLTLGVVLSLLGIVAITDSQASPAPSFNFAGSWAVRDLCLSKGCDGEVFGVTMVIDQAPGSSSFTGSWNECERVTSGTQSGLAVEFVEEGCGYRAIFHVTMSGDGHTFKGDYTDNGNGYGTTTGVRTVIPVPASLSLSVSLSSASVTVGGQVTAGVTVTAGGTAGTEIESISLGQGLATSSGAAIVTEAPASVSGFDLAAGTSRTFDFILQGAQPGQVTLSASATGSADSETLHASGSLVLTVVPQPPLVVQVSVNPKIVDLQVVPDNADSDQGEPVQATVRVKNAGNATLDDVHIIDKLLIAYDDDLPAYPVVPLIQQGGPTLAQGGQAEPAGNLGNLAPGQLSAPITFDLVANGDGGYSVEALATADKPGGGVLHGSGKASLTVSSPMLEFDAQAPDQQGVLLGAGAPYTINVTVKDLSYRKSVVVFPQFLAQGNAQVGPLISVGADVPSQSAASSCQIPQAVQLSPREEDKFRLVVYTSSAGVYEMGATGGGTRSVIITKLPLAGVVNDSGNGIAQRLTPEEMEMDPAAGTLLQASLSDPGLPTFTPQDYSVLSVASNLAVGALQGLGAFEWGLVDGIASLVKQGLSSIPTLVFDLAQYLGETWGYMKEDPGLMAAGLVSPLSVMFLTMVDHAPALKSTVSQLTGQISGELTKYLSTLYVDWYSGNYNAWARDVAETATETGLNVASLVPEAATCLMTRSAQFLEALDAARATAFAQAAEKVGDLTGIVSWTTATAKISDLVLGMELSYSQLAQLYGLTEEQVNFLQKFVDENDVILTVRSRAAQAITWLKEGAVLKPEQIKIKSVSLLDTQVLGYRSSDIGRIVLRAPISEDQLAANLAKAGIAPGSPTYLDAQKLYAQRISEYEHAPGGFAPGSGGYYQDLVEAAKNGKMELRWNLADNSVNPDVAENGFTTYDFRLYDEGDGNLVPQFKVEAPGPCVAPACLPGGWRSVTGDVDFLSMTDVEGRGLSTAKRVELYQQLAGGNPINMLHPAADTWTAADGDYWFPAKQNEFARAGIVPQFAPGRSLPTAVKFNPNDSWFKSAANYRVAYYGGYEGPLVDAGKLYPELPVK
ncbi:MAG TPA: hypothetical protein VMD59_17740 [Acidimicrobiales bacterium]|nr:hypothetical protein [Acidimicrobiales bacterium]